MPFVGRNAVIALGAESTPGTPVSLTNFRPVVSMEGSAGTVLRRRPNLRTAGTGVNMPISRYIAAEEPAGSFEVELTYENLGMWLQAAFGALGTTGPSSGNYTHTYTLDDLEGYTLEMIRGNATNSEVFAGVCFSRTMLKFAAGDIARMSVDWMGMTAATRTTPTSISYGSGDTPVLARQAGVLAWNSTNYTLNSLDVTIDRGTTRRPYLGSLTGRFPLDGEIRVTLRAELEYEADTLYTALRAGTQADGTFACTSSALQGTLTFQNAYVTRVSEPVQGHGPIKQTIEMECLGDSGGDKGLSFAVVNTNSSGTAN